MKYRVGRVAQLRGWQPGEFRLMPRVRDHRLVLRGVDNYALPHGPYRLRVTISELRLKKPVLRLRIPENGEVVQTAEILPAKRRIELTREVSSFDDHIKRVLETVDSRLDGVQVVEWLEDPTRRPQRKACLLNILAKLRTAPKPSDPLISDVEHIFFADTARIYAAVTPHLLARLDSLAKAREKRFCLEGEPHAPIHLKLMERIRKFGVDWQEFKLRSFRQEGKPSLQTVVAFPPRGTQSPLHYAEFDIDLGNPLQDIVGFFVHLGEVLAPGKTDHMKLRKKLAKGPTKDFLYYRVVKA